MWWYPRPNNMSMNTATLLVSFWAYVIFMYQPVWTKIVVSLSQKPLLLSQCSSLQWQNQFGFCFWKALNLFFHSVAFCDLPLRFFLSVGVMELGFQKLPPCVGRDQLLQKSCLSRADPPAKISKRESWTFILKSLHSFLHSPLWSHLCAGPCISTM